MDSQSKSQQLHPFRHALSNYYNNNPILVLILIQLTTPISFAVLYTTLVLFMTQKLHIPPTRANILMGLFIAYDFGLHILGGYIGGRLVSYRNLFVIGSILQAVSCFLFALQSITALYWGLALFLTGTGLNIPCTNMILTQQFQPQSTKRETAFFWIYSTMNIGFFIGAAIAGYFQISFNYSFLFIVTGISVIVSIFIIFSGWGSVKDKTTPLAKLIKEQKNKLPMGRTIAGLCVTLAVVILVFILLKHATTADIFMILLGAGTFILFIVLALMQKKPIDRNRLFSYVILSAGGLVFWSLYMLAPMGLTLFALHNVDRKIFNFIIPPQWIQNINPFIIVLGGFSLPPLLKKVRKYINFNLPVQFACSLSFIAIGFFILIIGIALASPNGLINFFWIAGSYVVQSLGELMIGPIGFAMIGLLATEKLQGIMMGSWMLLVGGSSGVIASYLSNIAIHDVGSTNPLLTNPGYSAMFLMIAVAATITAIILFCLVPFLTRLIETRVR